MERRLPGLPQLCDGSHGARVGDASRKGRTGRWSDAQREPTIRSPPSKKALDNAERSARGNVLGASPDATVPAMAINVEVSE